MKEKNFTEWWAKNSADYEKIGVNKIAAHSIWIAALEVFEVSLNEMIKTKNIK